MITRHDVAYKLSDYLSHRLSIKQIVSWAENAMMEEEFDHNHLETIRFIISRLGLADVKEFGLSWDDCEDFLKRLGYTVRVDVSEANQRA